MPHLSSIRDVFAQQRTSNGTISARIADIFASSTLTNQVVGAMISSREFLQDAGVSPAGLPVAPADVQPLLISAAITCVTAPAMARILTKAGRKVSSRTVANWLQSTRVWLGLPPANRGKRSRKYRRELEEWHRINGHPTADEIDGGWTPAHRRSPRQTNSPPAAVTNLPEDTPAAAVTAQPASPAPRSANSIHGDGCQDPGETPRPPKTDWAEEARKTAEFARQPQPTPQAKSPPLPEFKKPRATANMLTASPAEIESYAAAVRAGVAAYRADARKLGYEIADTWTGHGDPLRHATKIDETADSHETTSEWGISTP